MTRQIVYVVEDFDSEWTRTTDRMRALSEALDRSRAVGDLLEQFTRVIEVIYDMDTKTVIERRDIDWRAEVNQLMYGRI
jgi:hypothetical protein